MEKLLKHEISRHRGHTFKKTGTSKGKSNSTLAPYDFSNIRQTSNAIKGVLRKNEQRDEGFMKC